METPNHLNNLHLDAFREIGNIGAGNAATALAQMLQCKITMQVPEVELVPLGQLAPAIGQEEEPVSCVTTIIDGRVPASVLFILRAESAYLLTDLLLGRKPGSTVELDNLARSALLEVGNILTGSFLNALGEATGIIFKPSIPYLAFDMLASVISSALLEGGYYDEQVLVMRTQMRGSEILVEGHFLLIPYAGTLPTILKAIGFNV